jgi:glucose-1-phosphate thymidylyltransferase
MKVILPLAGLGTRMRPHTWSKPKPLLSIAGKPVLGHILDKLASLGIEGVVFIIGWLGDQIEAYVEAQYDFKTRYVVQEELRGQAHALYLARESLSGPCLIIFVDTLFEADLTDLESSDADVVAFVQEVEDPRRFGVAVQEGGRVVRLIEKPDTLEHRDAVVGIYYIREGAELVRAIEYLLENNIQTRGEFYLTDAIQVMIDRGAHVIARQVDVWEDCGQPDAVLKTHRYLLDTGHTNEIAVQNGVVIPPVHIAPSARIESAVVGPYVSVGENVVIRDAIVRDSIIEAGCTVEGVVLEGSLLGRNARITSSPKGLNVGDDDEIAL